MTTTITPRFAIPSTRVVRRVPEIVRLCAGRKVLHLGCADTPYTRQRGDKLLHNLLAQVTPPHNLWGLDISAEGIRILREQGFENLVQGNVESMGQELHGMEFDVIVAGEILEHVGNVGLFLTSVRSIMARSTELLITTPNATALRWFIQSVLHKEKVHPDHNYYYSYHTLKHLLEKFGLRADEIYYYQEVEGTGVSRVLDRLVHMAIRVSPAWADGVVVRAVRDDA